MAADTDRATLFIKNDGQAIVATNYWDSAWAKEGFIFLTPNAGALRVLLPAALEPALPDMVTAAEVIVSRGPWTTNGGRDAIELLFEDGSSSPYALHVSIEQCERWIPEDNQGGGFVVTVWTRGGGEVLRRPARYRKVSEIPCLAPWVDH